MVLWAGTNAPRTFLNRVAHNPAATPDAISLPPVDTVSHSSRFASGDREAG